VSGPVPALASLGAVALALWFAAPIDASSGGAAWWFWPLLVLFLALSWYALRRLMAVGDRGARALIVPGLFGVILVYLWQILVVGLGIRGTLLPAPSVILAALLDSPEILAQDFVHTFFKSMIPGYVIGCGSGLIVALLVDRVPFLQRGLLPMGNFASALPMVGVAPIMVQWFGPDWPSKAAVVVIMTFFPMLVNAIAGLHALGRIERDLMRTYAASYGTTLRLARLPAALPFLFNALKVNSTLALIGAIVAQFFSSPTVGMGFRISTEVGRFNIDIVWATIVVAALAGSLSYGGIAMIERRSTFWHPSFRKTA